MVRLGELGTDVYLSCGTMAMPGEPEVDYNIQRTPWEILSLSLANDLDPEPVIESPPMLPIAPVSYVDEDDISASSEGEDLDIDSFFKDLGAGDEDEEEKDGEEEESSGFEGRRARKEKKNSKLVSQNADKKVNINNIENLIKGNSRGMVLKDWKTPSEWLANPLFANHVGFEEWGKEDYFSELGLRSEEEWNDEDVFYAQSMDLVNKVTDLYLFNHDKQQEANDDLKYWKRCVGRNINPENVPEKEEISAYLTPDKHRGVVYSDEIIEMKGKLTLHPFQDPPAILYANDSFTHNVEQRTMNQIGTIRKIYDWSPNALKTPEEWEISAEVVEKIAPLLRYINHAASLKSTKVRKNRAFLKPFF